MSVFKEYAEYYDLLYADKDYAGEARFVFDRLGTLPSNATLLELGSGTGRHARAFSELGLRVTGVDQSPEMVDQARERNAQSASGLLKPEFHVGDIRSLRLGTRYDAVVSLFHVFSYQIPTQDLMSAFQTASEHLAPGGTFLFDFWYGPAVLADPPMVRVRRMRGSDFSVTRIAEPVLRENDNVVEVHYEVLFARDADNTQKRVREVHPMRYLFLPEIGHHLRAVGLELVDSGAWMRPAPLGIKTWYGWVSGRRL